MSIESRIAKAERAVAIESGVEDCLEIVLRSGEIIKIPVGLSLIDIAALVGDRTDQELQ